MNQPIRTKPEPYCPECGGRMKIRMPRPTQEWKAFWGCIRFPNCKGTIQIDQQGKPETDDDEWEF